jgi:hypothetical protein
MLDRTDKGTLGNRNPHDRENKNWSLNFLHDWKLGKIDSSETSTALDYF